VLHAAILLLVVRRILVVFPEQVDPEISLEIAPDGMDVVRVVLGVVVLDQKGRPL
jgi:hypothetical protein